MTPLIISEFSKISSTYVNTAYSGPIPNCAQAALLKASGREQDPSFFEYEEWSQFSKFAKIEFSNLLQIEDAQQCSFHASATEVIAKIASGFPFNEGDVVVSTKMEYPTDILPWMLHEKRSGYQFLAKEFNSPLNPAEFVDSLPKNTRIVNLSHVAFNTGRRLNIAAIGELLKKRDIFFVVDATQSLGGLQLTPEEIAVCDVIVCAAYKWLLGPYGSALAYWNEEAAQKITPFEANWMTAKNSQTATSIVDYTLETLPGATKFDRGQSASPVITLPLTESLKLLSSVGLSKIEKHNQTLSQSFRENLDPSRFELKNIDHELKSNIVCFSALKGDSSLLERSLEEKNIDLSIREGNVRCSFHLFNTQTDVDTLLSALHGS